MTIAELIERVEIQRDGRPLAERVGNLGDIYAARAQGAAKRDGSVQLVTNDLRTAHMLHEAAKALSALPEGGKT